MKVCSVCRKNKKNSEFRRRKDNHKLRNECRKCEANSSKQRTTTSPALVLPKDTDVDAISPGKVFHVHKDTQVTLIQPPDPREQKEIAMKRMLAGARSRARDKGLPFNLHYDDVAIPNLCPVLKIPMIPSISGHSDNSPSLDRMIPYLGYTKGNVRVISMKANRIKTDANSVEIEAVLNYVKQIEEENI